MADWCDDCAWPEACAQARECARREAGEVRAAALPDLAEVLREEVDRQGDTPLRLDRFWPDGRVQIDYAVIDGDAA